MDEQEQEHFFRRAEYAKVDREKLCLPSASVSFSPFVEQNKYRLIELNEQLESALKNGEDVVIRGDPQDGVVVCTDTKTFDIKICTTSNELLVSSDLIIPRTKEGPTAATADLVLRVHDYMEPKEILPKLDKLQKLLPTFALSNDSEPKGISTAELLDRVQSSKFQLQEELNRLGAIDRDGWKVVTDMERVSYSICTAIDSESWSLAAIDESGMVQIINEFEQVWPEWAIQHTLKALSKSEKDGTYEICQKKLSIQVALFILKRNAEETNQSIVLEEFTEVWKTMLPSEVEPDVKDLFGFAYVSADKSRGKTVEVIHYLNPLNLPGDPLMLFNFLFSLKKQWTDAELQALTKRVTPPGKQASAIISKYCRQSKSATGVKLFTIQHIK